MTIVSTEISLFLTLKSQYTVSAAPKGLKSMTPYTLGFEYRDVQVLHLL